MDASLFFAYSDVITTIGVLDEPCIPRRNGGRV
jgi:hypothetical protein